MGTSLSDMVCFVPSHYEDGTKQTISDDSFESAMAVLRDREQFVI